MGIEDWITPEGRWELLQNWLDDNPRNREIVEKWLDEPPDKVWPQLRQVICDYLLSKGDRMPAMVVKITPYSPLLGSGIEALKQKYLERQAMEPPRRKRIHGKRKTKRNGR